MGKGFDPAELIIKAVAFDLVQKLEGEVYYPSLKSTTLKQSDEAEGIVRQAIEVGRLLERSRGITDA